MKKYLLVKISVSIALCTHLFLCNGVRAQTVDRDKFQKFLSSSSHQGLVDKAVASISKEVFQRCPELKSPPIKIHASKSIEFGPDGIPNAGSWWERLPVSGCGNDTILNIYFEVAAGGSKINSIVALPGTTRASIILQQDALKFAQLGFLKKVTNCNQFIVKNTNFEGFGSTTSPVLNLDAAAKSQSWRETWTAAGCSRTLDIPMEFFPDGVGTRIVQPINGIIER
jgi:hypothetical protein